MRPQEFYGKPGEDPKVWYDNFIIDAAVNRWEDDQILDVVAGFFKGAARKWYVAVRNKLRYLQDNTDNAHRAASLYYQLVA